MAPNPKLITACAQLALVPEIEVLLGELRDGLTRYWQTAGPILARGGVILQPPGEAEFSLHKNFFSFLFLYSFKRAGIVHDRRILYAASLQCLRGMVTGCDNLLDDEYKPTLQTDIPKGGHRFRSVVDIMVSDRVLFEILLDAARDRLIDPSRVAVAAAASMQTMTRSGVQEASEEKGVGTILRPRAILAQVHHLKTGLLFQCPWDIPLVLESDLQKAADPLLAALYQIGMGCQIFDDLVDLASDIEKKRHNYVVALIYHGEDRNEREQLKAAMAAPAGSPAANACAGDYPTAREKALATAHGMLSDGLTALFAPRHQMLVAPAIGFLEARIGVAPLALKGRS